MIDIGGSVKGSESSLIHPGHTGRAWPSIVPTMWFSGSPKVLISQQMLQMWLQSKTLSSFSLRNLLMISRGLSSFAIVGFGVCA